MPKQKQEVALSFKISHALKAALDRECELQNRSNADMAKILLAEALGYLEAKRNTSKLL